ncbi:hypothetical protein PoB_004565000 [Plakobranchus ocellatus]|uniref:Uncharacterized protein n=1 Tax=Plakobranchus ocellatus TaxID=259542 RepID=A0AAV4BI02_9GAST|nr:hypothetical protein PoB_004565000 [Plakobranchus ocellatus]
MRKGLVNLNHLNNKRYVAVIKLKMPYLCGKMKTMHIPDNISNIIVGNVEGTRGAEDEMYLMVCAVTTIFQTLCETELDRWWCQQRKSIVESISLQQEDPEIQSFVDAKKTPRRRTRSPLSRRSRASCIAEWRIQE